MNPRSYQEFAERLMAAPRPNPAECRAAISRSYYACFNVGAEWLRSLGFPVGKGGAAHGEVRHCFNNSGIVSVTEAAHQLADLHMQRNRADYHLDRSDVERATVASALVQTAAAVIQSLDAAFSGPDRSRIQVNMQTWRRANGYP